MKAKAADAVDKVVAKAVGRPPKDSVAATKKSGKASKKAAAVSDESASASAPAEADTAAATSA
jgi:hypothetical protein